jgi:hypothetical protein
MIKGGAFPGTNLQGYSICHSMLKPFRIASAPSDCCESLTILDVPAGVAVHAPGVALNHVDPQLERVPPLDGRVDARLVPAPAALRALRVAGQARAPRLERLLLQAACPESGISYTEFCFQLQ